MKASTLVIIAVAFTVSVTLYSLHELHDLADRSASQALGHPTTWRDVADTAVRNLEHLPHRQEEHVDDAMGDDIGVIDGGSEAVLPPPPASQPKVKDAGATPNAVTSPAPKEAKAMPAQPPPPKVRSRTSCLAKSFAYVNHPLPFHQGKQGLMSHPCSRLKTISA